MDENVLRVLGGPYDGAEIDLDYIFAGRMPDKICIGRSGRNWMHANYELDIDARGPCYRFTHSTSAATVSCGGAE